MITVLHMGGPRNEYSVPKILGYNIKSIILEKKIRFPF